MQGGIFRDTPCPKTGSVGGVLTRLSEVWMFGVTLEVESRVVT